MNFFDAIMFPFRMAVSFVLGFFHDVLTAIGMDPASGFTWMLSIVLLVILIRTLLIPLFVKQIKASRNMQAMQPELQKLQAKYKGKKDQLSRQAMALEQQELMKKHGANPFSACLPMLVQMPFFFALFQVLNGAARAVQEGQAVGALSLEQVTQFANSTFLGAKMSDTFLGSLGENFSLNVILVTVVMILLMTASQFITQKQIMAKNMSETAMASPFMQQQKMMLYLLPIVFGIGGINFPIGVLIYWTATNIWTMAQQFWIIRNNPNPGSQAERELNERRAAKGLPPVNEKKTGKKTEEVVAPKPTGQRQQPVRKNRRKK
ncbi:membrane protein insertase YidC [Micrococcoides hystricis]|uniref:Membrane protein insertase YidC n=1 Tax=Micrococcoides hystricis TaxID=1572761 RepID=A0ABV6PBJ5_9MICC